MRSDLKVGIILGAVVVVAVIVMLAINGEKPPAPTNEDDNLIERHEGQSPTEQEPGPGEAEPGPVEPGPIVTIPSPTDPCLLAPVVMEPCEVMPGPVIPPVVVEEAEPAVEPALPAVVYHTVGEGESLSRIAEQHYGHERHWQVIYEANRSVIGDNPNRLKPGTKLRIPSPEEVLGQR